jgi:hypothetical protein
MLESGVILVTVLSQRDDDLTETERRLLDAVTTGALVDLRVGDPELEDPTRSSEWGEVQKVRAAFLAELLTGDRVPASGLPRGVKLRGARITGQLDLAARKLICPLFLRECAFDEAIDLAEAEASSIRLPGCRVPGLSADQLRTTGNVELNEGCTVSGEVRLEGAHIGGQLGFHGAQLTMESGPSVLADGLVVDGGMFCSGGFTARGAVRLLGAHITGQLSFSGASLTGTYGPALEADGLIVDGSMFCGGGFTADGTVKLPGVHVAGQLSFRGASLTGSYGVALTAVGLVVEGDMLCDENFTAHGTVLLLGAHIAGQLRFNGASLTNERGTALAADRLVVDQDLLCLAGFTARGEVQLIGAHIGGPLNLLGAKLVNPGRAAIDLARVHAQHLVLPREKPQGWVDLTNARTGLLVDDPSGWPDVIGLRGFVYDSLENEDVNCRERLGWLGRHPGRFTPQIYDQLADVYRRAGDEVSARKVAVAKQRLRRRKWSPLSWLWYLTVGYGYRTWQTLLWLAGLTIVGSVIFSGAHMIAITAHPPAFQPVVYTLDVLLPVVGLGQKAAWQPTDWRLDFSWILAGAGWVLAAAVVAGLTGVLKRDP